MSHIWCTGDCSIFGVFLVVPVQICVYVLLRAKLAADEHAEAGKVQISSPSTTSKSMACERTISADCPFDASLSGRLAPILSRCQPYHLNYHFCKGMITALSNVLRTGPLSHASHWITSQENCRAANLNALIMKHMLHLLSNDIMARTNMRNSATKRQTSIWNESIKMFLYFSKAKSGEWS